MSKFGQWATVHVVSELDEHRAADTPLSALLALSLKQSPSVLDGRLCGLRVDHLVEAGKHVTTRDILKGQAGLDQQAALRNLNRLLLPVSRPHGEARVARLTVDSQEGDVVVPAGEHSTHVVLLQVAARGGQQVSTALHLLSESVSRKAHANGSHLGNLVDRTVQQISPLVHLVFPLREAVGNHLVPALLRVVLAPLADLPVEAPLGVRNRRGRRLGRVSRAESELLEFFTVIASDLNVLRGGSHKVVGLWVNVRDFLTVVEAISGHFEIVFHHVNVLIVGGEVHARVPDENNSEFVEGLGYFLALDSCVIAQLALVLLCGLHVQLQVNDGDLGQVVAHHRGVRVEWVALLRSVALNLRGLATKLLQVCCRFHESFSNGGR